ncbi:hypothetical protein F2Q69_00003790 [Brassica cretica]|uniref:Uncharacterized protein n=1 Tax=Brassica cretica TaxID=69181 RepID=A0A8S9PM21_BRACR|nr:hypothetical protein F2Q69_00003790 [Brassica cretica]
MPPPALPVVLEPSCHVIEREPRHHWSNASRVVVSHRTREMYICREEEAHKDGATVSPPLHRSDPYCFMSMDYVRGRGSRDVWTIDAALVGGGVETSGLATQIVWGVGAETFAFDAALEGGGTETDCTSDAVSIGDNLSCGELLKDEVLGSSNAKRINNLPVDVEAVPPTVRG